MILYRYSKEKFCLGHSRSRIKPTKKKETFRIFFCVLKDFTYAFRFVSSFNLRFFLQHFTLLSCAFIQCYYPYTRFCYTYESSIFFNLIIDVLLAFSVRCMVDNVDVLCYTACWNIKLCLSPISLVFSTSHYLLVKVVGRGGGGLWLYSYRPPLLPTWEDK